MKAITLTMIGIIVLGLGACGKKDSGSWSQADKDMAMKNCMFGAKSAYGDQAQAYCDCWLEKVMKESPDATKQGSIPLQTVMKISADCAQSVKK